jgi:hypothetical protein
MKRSLFACALMGAIALASLPAFAGEISEYKGIEVTDLPGLTVTPHVAPHAQPHLTHGKMISSAKHPPKKTL